MELFCLLAFIPVKLVEENGAFHVLLRFAVNIKINKKCFLNGFSERLAGACLVTLCYFNKLTQLVNVTYLCPFRVDSMLLTSVKSAADGKKHVAFMWKYKANFSSGELANFCIQHVWAADR